MAPVSEQFDHTRAKNGTNTSSVQDPSTRAQSQPETLSASILVKMALWSDAIEKKKQSQKRCLGQAPRVPFVSFTSCIRLVG